MSFRKSGDSQNREEASGVKFRDHRQNCRKFGSSLSKAIAEDGGVDRKEFLIYVAA